VEHIQSAVTPKERYEMVNITSEPEGLYYDTELKMIAALKPRPAFLPVLRMLKGIVEYKETSGLLVTSLWCERNRRATNHRSRLALIPLEVFCSHGKDIVAYGVKSIELASDNPFGNALSNPQIHTLPQHSSGPDNPQWKIAPSEWPTVVCCVEQNKEPLRQIAKDYGVSYEAVRRVIRAARKQQQIR
jgi:hypothetical protein